MVPDWWNLLLPALAFAVAYGIADAVRRNASRLRLVQSPNERSSHKVPTPSGGGVSIAIAGVLAGLFLLPGSDISFWVALTAGAVAGIMGLLDDLYDLPSLLRLAIQFLLIGSLLASAGPLPPLATPFGALPAWLLYCLMALVGVWWINLFNFMDGIDGIATTEAIFFAGGVLALALAAGLALGSDATATWMLALVGASLGFLMLNWPPARIFMGDAGSNFLAVALFGTMLSLLVSGWIDYAAATILVATFVADATVTLSNRMIDRQRWFAAHRTHAYQKLSRYWGSHTKVTILNAAINLLWLFPLAAIAQNNAAFCWYIVLFAYAPVVIGCILCKAGRRMEIGSTQNPA